MKYLIFESVRYLNPLFRILPIWKIRLVMWSAEDERIDSIKKKIGVPRKTYF